MSAGNINAADLDGIGPDGLVDQSGVQVGPHECENADGQRVRFLVVDLDESAVQALCAACTMGMFVAVAAQLAAEQQGQVSDTPGGGV